MLDTFAVLEDAGIPYFGAGDNLQGAMEPLYMEVDGKTIALAAASRAEKYRIGNYWFNEKTLDTMLL